VPPISMCRWGIMSTATIGRKNWQAIQLSGNGHVVAVASRNASSSQKYIDECQAAAPFNETPRAIEGYENLISADDVDAVYIPLPTGMRKEWVIRAAQAGKHVMCEKPCACSADDLREMIEACNENNVQFMDGIMYMHGKRLEKIREAIGGIGKLKRIATQFSFCGDQEFEEGNIRTNSTLEPLGCLGDLGWYTIRFALWTMNYEMPKRVIGRMLTDFRRDDSPKPVPMELSAELYFDNGVTSSMYNSFVTGHQQFAHISGTKGHIYVPDFVLPYAGGVAKFIKANPEFSINDCDFEMDQNAEEYVVEEAGNSTPESQETNLFRNFANIVLSEEIDEHWPNIALQTQQLMDACYESAVNDGKVIEIAP